MNVRAHVELVLLICFIEKSARGVRDFGTFHVLIHVNGQRSVSHIYRYMEKCSHLLTRVGSLPLANYKYGRLPSNTFLLVKELTLVRMESAVCKVCKFCLSIPLCINVGQLPSE